MRSAIKRIFVILCLAALTVFLFGYAVAELSKQLPEDEIAEYIPDPQDPVSENSPEDEPLPDEPAKDPEFSMNDYLSTFPVSSENDGTALTDAVYDENCVIALLSIADRSILPTEAKYIVDGNSYFTFWPRMGYIVLADGSRKMILSSDGSVIPVAEGHDLSVASARDRENVPLFRDWSDNGKYVTLSNDGTVAPSDYDEVADFRGIIFDYPSYFGLSDNENCTMIHSARGFGYDIEGENAHDVPAVYLKGFNYSEGFGCLLDGQDHLYFYNTDGRLRIGGLSVVTFYGSGGVFDESALGYYYFDEGLTRATKKIFSRGKLVSEYHTFVDREGEEVKIPADYSVYSYSNGRMLLTKGNLFGYMTSRGRWICEPDYTYARPFFEGLAVVGLANGKKGMIDREGNYVLEPVFDEITDCSGGVICAFSADSGWQLFNKKAVIPAQETLTDETAPAEDAVTQE